jgi:hypothetical protein
MHLERFSAQPLSGRFLSRIKDRNAWKLAPTALVNIRVRLGLAQAYALQPDTAKAKLQYQDFLAPWNEAEPNISILILARLSTPSCSSYQI